MINLDQTLQILKVKGRSSLKGNAVHSNHVDIAMESRRFKCARVTPWRTVRKWFPKMVSQNNASYDQELGYISTVLSRFFKNTMRMGKRRNKFCGNRLLSARQSSQLVKREGPIPTPHLLCVHVIPPYISTPSWFCFSHPFIKRMKQVVTPIIHLVLHCEVLRPTSKVIISSTPVASPYHLQPPGNSQSHICLCFDPKINKETYTSSTNISYTAYGQKG